MDSKRVLLVVALLVIAGGIGMRLAALGDIPYGLYHDEAFYGLDALSVLDGEHRIYFPSNNGREGLHIYLMAGTCATFGRTEAGLRAASALGGFATLGAVYLLGHAWGNSRVGLLTAAITAGLLWHVHFSRIAFRAVSLPLMLALAAACGTFALRKQSVPWAAAAGVALGLSVYTYTAVRLVPFIMLLWLIYGLAVHRPWLWERRREIATIVGVTALVTLPFALFATSNPAVVFERVGQVGVWNAAAQQADPNAGLLANLWAVLGMFNLQGDQVWRHNIAGRPVFGPVMGVVFLVGIVRAGQHVLRREGSIAYVLALGWIGIMLVATLLTIQAPSFLRTIGAIPAVA
ncbi:MAG: glycosyltransferase family 39 protein [Anaerolineae bacterium]